MSDYMKKILEMLQSGEIPAGGLKHVNVIHDNNCLVLKNIGECNCDPEVEYMTPEGSINDK